MPRVGAAYARERFRYEGYLPIEHDGRKFNNDFAPLLSRVIVVEAPKRIDMFDFAPLRLSDTRP